MKHEMSEECIDQWSSTWGTQYSRWVSENILEGMRKLLMGYVKLKKIYYFLINSE
jgi:hypothetical protein